MVPYCDTFFDGCDLQGPEHSSARTEQYLQHEQGDTLRHVVCHQEGSEHSSASPANGDAPKTLRDMTLFSTVFSHMVPGYETFFDRYDGQGPEHSSGRVERYLQMSDDNPNVIPEMDPSLRRQLQQVNWQVCNVTTPANYFHVLRRQVRRVGATPHVSCQVFS